MVLDDESVSSSDDAERDSVASGSQGLASGITRCCLPLPREHVSASRSTLAHSMTKGCNENAAPTHARGAHQPT